MVRFLTCLVIVVCLAVSAIAQDRRLWVLKQPDSIVEYDPATFAPKHTIKIPEEILRSARILQIDNKGQMLFAPNTDDPSPDVGKNGERFWFWDRQSAAMLGRGIMRITGHAGSNQKVTETSPWPFLSADGSHLFWFTNQFNKLGQPKWLNRFSQLIQW